MSEHNGDALQYVKEFQYSQSHKTLKSETRHLNTIQTFLSKCLVSIKASLIKELFCTPQYFYKFSITKLIE
jgi:hypothetical protein